VAREGLREDLDVGHGEIQSLGARRGHHVRRIAREEKARGAASAPDGAAHPDHDLVRDAALLQRPAVGRGARAQLGPDALVGPILHAIRGVALQVHPLQRGRARAEEREPARCEA
jgi:hypothetical protein